jgi:hypothetical protein
MQKIYCYVDETGQDTKGLIFLVCCSVVLDAENKTVLEEKLAKIEKRTKKKNKWNKTKKDIKAEYLRSLLDLSALKGSVYISRFLNTKEYFKKILDSVASSLKTFPHYKGSKTKVVVIIDGLPRQQEPVASVKLRRRGIFIEKVRGTKDEVTPLVRLSDALVGLARNYLEGTKLAKEFYPKFISRGIIKDL